MVPSMIERFDSVIDGQYVILRRGNYPNGQESEAKADGIPVRLRAAPFLFKWAQQQLNA